LAWEGPAGQQIMKRMEASWILGRAASRPWSRQGGLDVLVDNVGAGWARPDGS
jgi:hypothetical protein